ncbi:MAG: flagellar biosynthetic protein FliO [Alphaproteobacteria bacterium]|nr:flagellar biosynthetic protein FliO [Alphaproteobacteria bacterium]
MHPADYVQFALALIFVLGLIGLCAALLKRFGPGGLMVARPRAGATKRLHIVDSLTLDPRRRLILVRRDGVEHLILLGAQSDLAIETGIDATHENAQDAVPAPNGVVRRFDDVVRRISTRKSEPQTRDEESPSQ